jgi:hypothetical protein
MPPARLLLLLVVVVVAPWWWWQIKVSRDSLMSDWIYLLALLLCFCTDRTPCLLYYIMQPARQEFLI